MNMTIVKTRSHRGLLQRPAGNLPAQVECEMHWEFLATWRLYQELGCEATHQAIVLNDLVLVKPALLGGFRM